MPHVPADPFFGPPFIDVNKQLSSPFPHRYVHGGFEGTDTRFALYFPEASRYRGRALQWLEGGAGGHEGPEAHSPDVTAYYLELASSLGAYWVESNQGHIGPDPGPDDPTVTTYRASLATALYARELAEELYGEAPHHSYLFGGSGGGMRSILCMENTTDIWDGAVPFVAGDPSAVWHPGEATAAAVANLLGSRLHGVVDAIEPGGTGDPYADLDALQAQDLRSLLEAGFPAEALFQFSRPSLENLMTPQLIQGMERTDPEFVSEFWSDDAYLGGAGALDDRLIDVHAVVSAVIDADELRARGINDHDPSASVAGVAPGLAPSVTAVTLEPRPPQASEFATVVAETGKAKGATFSSLGTFGDVALLRATGPGGGAGLTPGDSLSIDNRTVLAFANHHRYAAARERAAAPFPLTMLPMTGRFAGKMILVNGTLDASVTLPAGIAYDALVRKTLDGATDARWRFWLVENAGHVGAFGPPGPPPVLQTRLASYRGVVDQALADLVAWVEEGREPAPSTKYKFPHGRLELPADAGERGGLQPVVTATVNGGTRADIRRGQTLTFEVEAAAPTDGGSIIEFEWDFLGTGEFPYRHKVGSPTSRTAHSTSYTFEDPGTYFPAVRVTARRPGSPDGLAKLENIARVRVVVTG
jgi:hypothetical protein